jgi:hypothetical protein
MIKNNISYYNIVIEVYKIIMLLNFTFLGFVTMIATY